MKPIPETSEALAELELSGDLELRGELQRLTAQAKEPIPGLVGVSLGLRATAACWRGVTLGCSTSIRPRVSPAASSEPIRLDCSLAVCQRAFPLMPRTGRPTGGCVSDR